MRYILMPLALLAVSAFAADKTPLPTEHTTRNIEGWAVRLDDRLLHGDGASAGERALKLLAARIVAITLVIPEKSIAKLRVITIEPDLNYGDLRPMQYHPDAGCLKENGYSEHLAKCVHVPEAEDFLSAEENLRMPCVMLHELVHGFHDQTIGFDDPQATDSLRKFRDSENYKSVLTTAGKRRKHYWLTDQKEFFAEMAGRNFGSNDCLPFVTGEPKQAELEIIALPTDVWGSLPDSALLIAKANP